LPAEKLEEFELLAQKFHNPRPESQFRLGMPPLMRAERYHILQEMDRLAFTYCGRSFDELCKNELPQFENGPSSLPIETTSEVTMPVMGKHFLKKGDLDWIVQTVNAVIDPMGVTGIKNLLRDSLPESSIDRINYREASRNVAEAMVGMLELRGALNPPDYHALGRFLKSIIEEDHVGYDAAAHIVALLFEYTLVKNKAQITELSSRFGIPSPTLTTEVLVRRQLRLSHFVEENSIPDRWERLESLYNNGIRHYVDANFLIKGSAVIRAVCRIEFANLGEGTGFLVAPNLVLTNYHVLMPSKFRGSLEERARKCKVRFGAIRDEEGGIEAGKIFSLHNNWHVASSEQRNLDYYLLRLQESVDGITFSPISLTLRDQPIEKDEFVNIVHHPNRGPMEVSLRYNQVVEVEEKRIYYLADTEAGSSGSPVFDDHWQLVALHHSGGEKDSEGNLLLKANAGVPIDLIFREIQPHLVAAGSQREE
jgi:V8-like Glu-specific endopeptidase